MATPIGWSQTELNLNNAPAGLNPCYQWDSTSPQGRMMLNTDMVSWFDVIMCKIIYLLNLGTAQEYNT